MRKNMLGLLALVVTGSAPLTSAAAQSEKDFAGWVGLITTPVGALPPVIPTTTGMAFQARYGHWQFASDDDNTSNYGIGLSLGAGRSRATVVLGYTTTKDCTDCGQMMAGFELHVPLVQGGGTQAGGIGIALNPAVGYAKTTASDAELSFLSIAVSLPISVSVPLGASARIVPFVSPGAGMGRISGSGESQSGTRMLLGGGVVLADAVPRLQITGSFQKIFIDHGVTMFGLALTLGK